MRYLVSSLLTLPLLISCTSVQQDYYAPGFYNSVVPVHRHSYQAPHPYQGQVVSHIVRHETVHHGHGATNGKKIIRHPKTRAQVQQNVHGHDEPQGNVHGHSSPAVNGSVMHQHNGSAPVQAKSSVQHRHG